MLQRAGRPVSHSYIYSSLYLVCVCKCMSYLRPAGSFLGYKESGPTVDAVSLLICVYYLSSFPSTSPAEQDSHPQSIPTSVGPHPDRRAQRSTVGEGPRRPFSPILTRQRMGEWPRTSGVGPCPHRLILMRGHSPILRFLMQLLGEWGSPGGRALDQVMSLERHKTPQGADLGHHPGEERVAAQGRCAPDLHVPHTNQSTLPSGSTLEA